MPLSDCQTSLQIDVRPCAELNLSLLSFSRISMGEFFTDLNYEAIRGPCHILYSIFNGTPSGSKAWSPPVLKDPTTQRSNLCYARPAD